MGGGSRRETAHSSTSAEQYVNTDENGNIVQLLLSG